MKKDGFIWWLLAGAAGLFGLVSANAAPTPAPAAPATPATPASPDLSGLDSQYGDKNVALVDSVFQSLQKAVAPKTGLPLNEVQQNLLMAQMLQESGLFTSTPGWGHINSNNFAGIKNSKRLRGEYPELNPASQVFAKYPNVDAFVKDWLTVVSFDYGAGPPITATTVDDFLNRLIVNTYIVGADIPPYKKNVPVLYNFVQTNAL